MARFIFVPDEMPPLKDARMTKLARDFIDTYVYWGLARQPLVAQWDENTRAWQCRRKLPFIDGLPYIDADSPWGPTDIFDALNSWSTRIGLAMFPKDDSWLSIIGRSGEDPTVTNAVKATQLWVNRKANTRSHWSRHLKQCALLGFSPMLLDWHQETEMRPIAPKDQMAKLKAYARQQGVDPAQIRNFNKAQEAVITFNGPVVKPLNSRDVRLDPEADLSYDRKPAFCIETYRRPSDLANEKGPDGKTVYSNLDKLGTINAAEIYFESTEMVGRLEHQNTLGIYPQNYGNANTQLIKVLIFYMPYIKTADGLEFYNTYFHVGINGQSSTDAYMIRVEDSPTTITGSRHLIMETFIDWFTGHPYGISAVEKLVAIYDRKAFIDALQLAAAAASAFPALLVGSGALKDDILDRTPAAINEVAMSALGQQFVQNVPSVQEAAEFGMQQMRWYGQEIAQSFGSQGSNTSDDPTRSVSSRETATAAKIAAAGGNTTIDEQTEKFGNSQQEAQQWILDTGRIMLADSTEQSQATDGTQADVLRFGVIQGNNASGGELKFDEYDQPRWVECLGLHGAVNKAQMIQDKTQALQIVGQNAQSLPNAPALQEKLIKSIFTDLNIETEENDWMTPMDLAAANPQVQMQALMDGMDNPQIMMAAQQQKMAEQQAQQQPQMPQQQGAPING